MSKVYISKCKLVIEIDDVDLYFEGEVEGSDFYDQLFQLLEESGDHNFEELDYEECEDEDE